MIRDSFGRIFTPNKAKPVKQFIASILLWAGLVCRAAAAEPAKTASASDYLSQAKTAYEAGKLDQALGLITQALNLEPKNERPYYYRAQIYETKGRFAEAIADYDSLLKLNPDSPQILQLRGSEYFKAGRVKESVADFDRYLALKPDQEPYHWQRGISHYYAGQFEEGRKQFELHQTVNPNDVENAVWHFLCNARVTSLEKAQAALIKIEGDPRVPLMQVQALFGGKAKPEDVIAAAKAGNPSEKQLKTQMFYANLYLGLYYEAMGNEKLSLEHITAATTEYLPGNYMWDVARVHLQLRKAKQGQPAATGGPKPAK